MPGDTIGEAYIRIRPRDDGFEQEVTSKVGGTARRAAGLVAGAFAGAQAIGFFKDAIAGASDLSESISKNNTVFGEASAAVIAFSEGAAKGLGQSQAQALEATGVFGNLIRSLGVGAQPAADMSVQFTKLASDLASFNNTDVGTALDALRAGLTGETEPLKKFGVNINDATLKAEAMRMGLIKSTKEALDPQAKAMASYSLIMAQTGLAQGDFARTSGGLANQQRILSAQFTDVKAKVGAALLPAMTSAVVFINGSVIPALIGLGQWLGPKLGAAISFIRDGIGQFMEAFRSVRTLGSWDAHGPFEKLGVAVARIIPVIQELAATWLPRIREALAFVVDHWKLFAAGAVLVVAPLAAVVGGLIYAYTHSERFRDIVQTVFAWLRDNVPPIVQGVVEAVMAAWSWLSENVPPVLQVMADVALAVFGWLRDNVPPIVQAVTEGIVTAFRWVNDNVVPVVTAMAELVIAVVQRILDGWQMAWPLISGVVQAAWTLISGIVQVGVDLMRTVIEGAMTAISLFWGPTWTIISTVLETIWGTMRVIVETALGVIRGVIETVTALIHGDWSGAWEGIKQVVSSVWDGIKGLVQTGINAVEGIITGAMRMLGAAWDLAWWAFANAPRALWDAVKGVVGSIVGAVEELYHGIVDWLQKAADWVRDHADAILGPLDEIAGAIGKVGGSIGGAIGGALGFHVGGVVGVDPGGRGRTGPMRADEYVTLLRKGETVFTEGQMAALGSVMARASSVTGGAPGGGGDSISVTVVIDGGGSTEQARRNGEVAGAAAARVIMGRQLALGVRP